MSVAYALIAILGLAVLMVVHEGGHYLAARRLGMRVTKFSIGFGPTLWKHRPKGSPTTFQIAIIPFLAYVQIAGMNPYEEIDQKDPESYANASLWARIATIAAGPLANYLFASVLMFFGFFLGGNQIVDETSMRVSIGTNGPAAQVGIQTGDRILSVNGEGIHDWDHLKRMLASHRFLVHTADARYEDGYNMAVLEAMAAGLPIVASGVGGIPELVDNGRTGLLVRQGNPKELADRLCDLMADPARAAKLGAAARSEARSRYSFDRMVAAFEGLYLTRLESQWKRLRYGTQLVSNG